MEVVPWGSMKEIEHERRGSMGLIRKIKGGLWERFAKQKTVDMGYFNNYKRLSL